MAQRVVCRSPASTCRLSSVATFSGKNVASLGRTATTRPQLSARHRSVRVAAVLDVTEDTFDAEVLKADLPVLVDFWATWCGPCKLVAPSMVWAENEFGGQLKVVKVDCTTENKALMETYKVYGLPCLIVFKDGAVVEGSHREGAITRKDLGTYIEQHVGLKVSA